MKISIFWLLCLTLLASCGNSNENGMKARPSEKAKNLIEQEENPTPEHLYRIVSTEQWQESLLQNQVVNSSLDKDFIHLATEEQLTHIVQEFWNNKDHIILKLASKKLKGRLVYEVNPGGTTLYYHLYEGNVPLDAVVDISMVRAINRPPTVRAAIDVGSGAVKIQMAVVDPEENLIIGKPLVAKYVPLGLIEDVATHDGCISEEMRQKALSILRGFKEEVLGVAAREGHPSVQFTAVATAVFRKAQNGNDLLQMFEEQLGIRFQILSQDEEGRLGFLTAKALYPDVSETSLLAWDSGNGSFQMTIKEGENYQIYQGPLGHGTVRVLLSKDIRNGFILQTHESGNPVLQEEAIELTKKINSLLPPTPDWLHKKLNSDKTVIATFGDGESIFALTAQALANLNGIKEPVQQATISFSDVQRVIDTYIKQKDEVFNAAGLHCKTLTSASHLSAVMQHFGIQRIYYKRSIGNTAGMLIAPRE